MLSTPCSLIAAVIPLAAGILTSLN